ncbi:MAG TPA: 2-phosphosulfolactate phosphatase [Gaiellaceae bacterium]|jgi:2-phosphosulfolactate phosphatase|nr:2-phosphosulfolactate phosphatase [Gaiellaceae bacterium]
MPLLRIVPAIETTPYDVLLAADPVVVVTDVIRATTTGTTALARGNRCIAKPTVEAAREAAAALDGSVLLAGEQGGDLIDGFDLNNSPAAVDRIEGKIIILVSSSGTRVLHGASRARDVYVSCLRNVSATVRAVAEAGRDAVLLAACTRGEFRDEDRLLAGWMARDLGDRGFAPADDLTRDVLRDWAHAGPEDVLESESVAFLRRAGHEDDLDFILGRIDDLAFPVKLVEGEFVRDA